jgi:hypothetical protein
MNIKFKISLLTLFFALYVIISASFNRQIYNFITFDMVLPKKITGFEFKKISARLNDDKQREFFGTAYLKSYKGDYYLINLMLKTGDKEKTRKIFINNGMIDHINLIIWLIFAVAGGFLIFYLIKTRINIIRFIALSLVFSAGVLYAFTINENIIERIHLILFGVIGFLIAKDNFKDLRIISVFYCVFLGFFVSSLDESFQFFLPYRVADFRDIFFGTIGCFWGGLTYLVLNIKFNKKILNN